jgi:hypothetical protein
MRETPRVREMPQAEAEWWGQWQNPWVRRVLPAGPGWSTAGAADAGIATGVGYTPFTGFTKAIKGDVGDGSSVGAKDTDRGQVPPVRGAQQAAAEQGGWQQKHWNQMPSLCI